MVLECGPKALRILGLVGCGEPAGKGSDERAAAVDDQGLAGQIIRVAEQEEDGVGDIAGGAFAPQGDFGGDTATDLGVEGIGEECCSGSDRIDPGQRGHETGEGLGD